MSRLKSLRLLLLMVPLLLVAARCIDNDTLYRDSSGDLHIVGEMHNDTDVQGSEMVLGGTLFDAAGNTLATAQAPICPFELSPHTTSVFDVQFFHSSTVPQPARYQLRTISGKALPSPLPALNVDLTGFKATRSGDTVTVEGSIHVRQQYDGDFSGCAAFYDASGHVVRQITLFGFGSLPPSGTQPVTLPLPANPAAATGVRFWLVGPPASGQDPLSSAYAAAVTGLLPIG